jgi:hypothetical protein
MRLMHALFSSRRAWTLLFAAALLGLVPAARAAQTPAAPPVPAKATPSAPAKAATNAAPAEAELPKSVFNVPATAQEGRDPFFPQSTRLHKGPVASTTTTNLPAVVVELELKGISGTASRPLAIINNQTFGANEEGVVSTASGPARIRCLEIKTDSVRVFVNGQERVLSLRRNR